MFFIIRHFPENPYITGVYGDLRPSSFAIIRLLPGKSVGLSVGLRATLCLVEAPDFGIRAYGQSFRHAGEKPPRTGPLFRW
jgi:hypothetical protein